MLIKNNVKFSVFVFLHTNNLLYKYKYYNNYLFIIHSLYTAQGTSTRTDRVVPRASPRSAVFGRRSGARRTRFFATRTSSSPIWPASTTRRLSPSSRNRARTASTATMCSPWRRSSLRTTSPRWRRSYGQSRGASTRSESRASSTASSSAWMTISRSSPSPRKRAGTRWSPRVRVACRMPQRGRDWKQRDLDAAAAVDRTRVDVWRLMMVGGIAWR